MPNEITNTIIKQQPEIVTIKNANITNSMVDISLAIITLLAVIIALFQEKIRKSWNKAKLDMQITLEKPHSHQIALTRQIDGQFAGNSIYIRIVVKHIKGAAGENIEIIPTNFWIINENNVYEKVKHFLPINLAWSHFQPKNHCMRVPVGLFRHCDFGHIIKRVAEGYQSILILDTIAQPNPVADNEVPNVIKPGKYCFELLLTGDNTKSIRKKWIIEFGEWSDDENIMLTQNIQLYEFQDN